MHQPPTEYSARDLAELAGTTVRTIHYYTAEGLLPPPAGTTRGATYGPAHLARLRIIGALREEGLALGKIRERLASLTDEQAEHVADSLAEHLAAGEAGPLTTLGLIDLEVTRQNLPVESFVADAMAPPSAPAMPSAPPRSSARDYLDQLLRREGSPPKQWTEPLSRVAPPEREQAKPVPVSPEVWYEYELADGVQLRLREDRYRQAKVRPGALIDALRVNLRRAGLLRYVDQKETPDNR